MRRRIRRAYCGPRERPQRRARARPGDRCRHHSVRNPKLRKGSDLPAFLTPRRRWEQAFTNVVAESFVLGVSTRKVEDLVEAMGATGMSENGVSRMAAVLDDQVNPRPSCATDVVS